MSADEGFLARWSRRKQQAARAVSEAPAAPEPASPAEEAEAGATPASAEVRSEPERVLSDEEIAALPRPEELTAEADLSAFMRAGVPAALRNAALRRMWLLDPGIRDFVDTARDYAYDWNAPETIPGFGELSPSMDARAMARRILGEGADEMSENRSAAPVESGEAEASGEQTVPPLAEEPRTAAEGCPGVPCTDANSAFEAGAQSPVPSSDESRTHDYLDRKTLSEQGFSGRHGGALPV